MFNVPARSPALRYLLELNFNVTSKLAGKINNAWRIESRYFLSFTRFFYAFIPYCLHKYNIITIYSIIYTLLIRQLAFALGIPLTRIACIQLKILLIRELRRIDQFPTGAQ